MNGLEPIVAATREEVARRREAVPLPALEPASGGSRDDPFATSTTRWPRPGLSVIAEHKRRSPSAGAIRADLELEDVVGHTSAAAPLRCRSSPRARASAGRCDDLRAARQASELPILRKDFIVDQYQVHEALAAGADAILLIVAALDTGGAVRAASRSARSWASATLVEVHDDRELDAALALGASVIGINNRDLTTLQVDTRRTFELLPRVLGHALVVAESGFSRAAELDELARAGVDAVLIGEALMRSPDVESACRALALR